MMNVAAGDRHKICEVKSQVILLYSDMARQYLGAVMCYTKHRLEHYVFHSKSGCTIDAAAQQGEDAEPAAGAAEIHAGFWYMQGYAGVIRQSCSL